MKSSFSIFSFMNCALGVTSENSLANWRPLRFFPLFIFSNWFAFYIRSMTYVELFFGKDIRSVSRFFFSCGYAVVPAPFVEKTLLSLLDYLCSLSKISWLYLSESISGLFVVFHASVCVFFHWYHSLNYCHFLVSQVVSVLFVLFLQQWWLFWVFRLSIETLVSFCCFSESGMLGFLLGFC